MKKFYTIVLVLIVAFTHQLKAQTTFSFTCSKDTVITDCSVSCITLMAKIPDVRSSTNSYVLNPLSAQSGCFNNYVNPGTPGTATSIDEDDTYSSLIPLP